MLGILFVLGAIFSTTFSNAARKMFTKKCPIFFAFVCCIFADLFFVFISGFKFDFNRDVLLYAFLFAFAYSFTILFLTFAYRVGSFSFSGLVISYSLILPTLYGIFFLGDNTSWLFLIGLVLLLVATFMISYKKENCESKEKKAINLKWILYITIAFLGNGFCKIFQTAEQNALDGLYKNELMIIALSISAIVFLCVSLFTERKNIKDGLKQSLVLGSTSGLLNGALNLCVMFSVNYINSSIVFPLISVGGLVLMFIIARLFFKEKYTLSQYVGFAVSIVSVVLLNL